MSADLPNHAPDAAAKAVVIIPHYNDVARLLKCLDALMPQLPGQPVELLVVDNNSTADLSPVRAAYPELRILTETRRGAAAARNLGVAQTEAPWLFFTDADCVPAPDWIATALTLAGQDEIIGGRVDVFDETPPPRSGAEAFETVFAFPQRAYVEQQKFSVTANLLTTRAVFDAVGEFDGSKVEDSDWCHRAGDMGYRVRYEDHLAVSHPTRNDWAALRKKWDRTCKENYFKNGTTAKDRLHWGLRAFAVLVSGPLHLPRVFGHDALSGPEKSAAAVTLLRLRVLRAGWMLRQALCGETPINV